MCEISAVKEASLVPQLKYKMCNVYGCWGAEVDIVMQGLAKPLSTCEMVMVLSDK